MPKKQGFEISVHIRPFDFDAIEVDEGTYDREASEQRYHEMIAAKLSEIYECPVYITADASVTPWNNVLLNDVPQGTYGTEFEDLDGVVIKVSEDVFNGWEWVVEA